MMFMLLPPCLCFNPHPHTGMNLAPSYRHLPIHGFNPHPHTGMNGILFGCSRCNALEPIVREPPKDMRQHPSFPGEILRKPLLQAIREPPEEILIAKGSHLALTL